MDNAVTESGRCRLFIEKSASASLASKIRSFAGIDVLVAALMCVMNAYTIAADIVVVAHMAYVLFVVLGLVAILVGYVARWDWVRNKWFRLIHLSTIGIVVFESLMNITCPLTTLENSLRQAGGQPVSETSFIGRFAHDLIFFELPPSFFTAIYCTFGALVVGTLFLVPIRKKHSTD